MFLKTLIILILLFCRLVVNANENKEIICKSDMKETSDISSSFENLKKSIIYFFSVSFAKIENKRRQMKKAFRRFINEVFYNKPPCSLRFSDTKKFVPEIIVHDGYQVETHTVLTPDGYILSIHRIVRTTMTKITGEREIAIIGHGLLGSSIDWILLGPKNALPYLLSDAGYDVWLPNFRGNKYSKSHMAKEADSPEFWNFSWHEIGVFDIPTVIDYINDTTGGKPRINLIAYCMSGSALLVLLSTSQRYNAILKSVTLLAPLVYMHHVEGPLKYLAELYRLYKNDISTYMAIESEFKFEKLYGNLYLEKFCIENRPVCKNLLLLLGYTYKKNDSLRTYYNSIPRTGSTKTIIHYLQTINSGQFHMFDLGESNNYVNYGNASPPRYQLSNVKIPLILFNAVNDTLSTFTDIAKLKFDIPRILNNVVKYDNFSHLDFIWDKSATQLVYIPLLKELKKI